MLGLRGNKKDTVIEDLNSYEQRIKLAQKRASQNAQFIASKAALQNSKVSQANTRLPSLCERGQFVNPVQLSAEEKRINQMTKILESQTKQHKLIVLKNRDRKRSTQDLHF